MNENLNTSSEKVILKGCPFCGNYPKLEKAGSYNSSGIYIALIRVRCISCNVRPESDWFEHKAEAIAAWNRRTPESGTSVVRWVRYDGMPQTLPEEERICLLKLQKMICVGDYQNGYWWVWDNQGQRANDLPVSAGDLWAPLPEPPEGMGD